MLLTDNSLRDGEQSPEVSYTIEEKVAIARMLDAVGVHGMNVGFPAVSEQERHCIREILATKPRMKRISALSRLLKADVDHVVSLGVPWISLFAPTSDSHLRDKLRQTEAEVLAQMEELIPYAAGCGLNVQFGIEDATRTPLERLLRFIRTAEDLGARAIGIADTVGVLTPSTTFRLFSLLRPVVRGGLASHFHNDLGMATANALTAFEAGADQADCTVLGLGERAGNSRLEELAVILTVAWGKDLGLRLDLLPELAAVVSRASGVPIPPNKPIVGERAAAAVVTRSAPARSP